MQILHTAYEQNKRASLEGLEQYYSEVLGADDDTVRVAANPYDATGGAISLEAQNEQGSVGRLLAKYDDLTNSIRIETLFVENDQRGKNIGGLLVQHLEDDARANEVQMLFVDTTLASAPGFYRKQGFDVIGEIENYPVKGDTYILMMKRI